MTLRELGHELELGAGVAAAQRVFLEAGVPVVAAADEPAAKVLVKEKIGDSGVALLRDAGFDVELGVDWDDGELQRRIGEYDGILIRSATRLTADLIDKADRLKAVGRAGVGVDNVDVDAATKRGVVVERAAVERDHRRGAHARDAAGAGPQGAAGARLADRRRLGALEASAASSCTRRRSGCSASAASASSSRSGRSASA